MAANSPARADTDAGAVSHDEQQWHAIDWRAAHESVRRLQARMGKATQEGRWGKVRALQRLLPHSYSGTVLAVRRVTENQGSKTAGLDRATWDTPAKQMAAVRDLQQRGYKPRRLRRISIATSTGKLRPLGLPTMKDRAMQALYLQALDPVAETSADPNSDGFRPERSCADAVAQCCTTLAQKTAAQWVLAGDSKACCDQISHDWLLAHVPMDKPILRTGLKAGYREKDILHPTEDGTPQGGICSPVLANLALDGLERRLREALPPTSRRGRQAKVHFSGYADDFVVTGSSKELLENEGNPLIEPFMRERGLHLSAEKTVVTHSEEGFDFLGQPVRKYRGKMLLKPSKKNVKAFLGKVRKVITDHATATAGNLLLQLNPLIRGWASYHRHVVSKRSFSKSAHAIYQSLWRWARRRHHNKSRGWVKAKYVGTSGGNKWVCFGEVSCKQGETQKVWLTLAARTPIRRHVKLQGEANPYDPQWEGYFEERLGVKLMHNLRNRRTLRYLGMEQTGLCPVCGQKITKLTRWHNHPIVWRAFGGSEKAESRVLLHPNCHRQVHSQRLTVVKPRLEEGVRKA